MISRKGPTIYRQKDKANFRMIAQQWIAYKNPQIKESTQNKYLITLQKRIYPYLETFPIEEITKEHIEDMVSRLLSCGKNEQCGFSPKTVSDTISIINSIMKYAQDHGYQIQYHPGSVQIRKPVQRVRVLELDEQKKLCNYLVRHPDRRNLGILLSLFTGIRLGELCALRWENISMSRGSIYICKTMQRLYHQDILLHADTAAAGSKTYVVETEPKSSCSIRTIPIPEQLLLLMQKYEQDQGYFLTGDGTRFIEPRSMQNYFQKVLLRNRIEKAHFHVLRHTFATRCIELGFDFKSLSEILGHANVNITMNRYVHPSMDTKRDNMSRLNDLLSVIQRGSDL